MDLAKEIRKIKYIVEDTANVCAGSLDSKTRKREIVLARMVFANFLQYEVGLKEETMTRHLLRDRSSFYHYQKQHEKYIENDKIYPEYNDLYYKVKLRYYSQEEKLFDGTNRTEKIKVLYEINNKLSDYNRQREVLENEINTMS